VYDAAGVKLIKRVFENNILKSKTDYLGEFFYEANSETTTLQYIHTAEGRAIPKNDGSYLYEYHYKDHLGNLRLAFGTERTVATMTAETENAVSENAFFNPLNTYRSTQQFRTGTQSAKLEQNQQLETNFIDTRAGNQFLLGLYAFTTTSLTGERISSETLEFNTPLLTNSYLPNNEGTAKFTPNLNLLALLKFLRKKENKSNERTTATYTVRLKVDLYSITKTLISSSVYNFPLTSHSWVSVSPSNIAITNTSVAFVKFTLVNPNTFPIFIDDWKIEEKGKVVVQENHYDPYGFELFGLDKKGNPEHDYQYNGKEHLTDLGVEWDDYGARTRDRQLHIWWQVDPLAEKMRRWSPYAYAFSNPVRFVDPDGMAPSNCCGGGAGEAFKSEATKLANHISQKIDEVKQSFSNIVDNFAEVVSNAVDNLTTKGDEPLMRIGSGETRKSGVAIVGEGYQNVIETDKSSNVREVPSEDYDDLKVALNLGEIGSKALTPTVPEVPAAGALGALETKVGYDEPKVDTVNGVERSFNNGFLIETKVKFRVVSKQDVYGNTVKDTTHKKYDGINSSWFEFK
jgi:RHS repeat-associated protein